jgi:hypothetical protein
MKESLKVGGTVFALGVVSLFAQESWKNAVPVFPEGKVIRADTNDIRVSVAGSRIIIDLTTNAPVRTNGFEQAASAKSEAGEIEGPGKGPDMPPAPSVGQAPSAGPAPSVGKAPSVGQAPSVGTAPKIRN